MPPVKNSKNRAGTAKARDICETIGASRLSLAEFYGDGARAPGGALLAEMRRQSRPIKPRDLGLIGAEHFAPSSKV